jgi:PAS domain S-box-containing protein
MCSYEITGYGPHGTTAWYSSRLGPVRRDGRVVAAALTCTDITERKRAEEALREEKDFAEGLIATAQAVVLVLDAEGRIVRSNPYLEELSGYRPEEMCGRDWLTLLIPEPDRPRAREMILRALSGDGSGRHTTPVVTRGGAERAVEWSSKALRGAGGEPFGVLAIGHDITLLREAQRQALQAERLAAIGQMVAGLTHESRNALQRSQACLEMLALEVQDRPQALDLVARTRKAQGHLHHLFEEVRDYAAPLKLKPQPCDLGELLQEVWNDLAWLRQGREARLRAEAGGADLRCAADRFRLAQVFRNVLENALSACGGGLEVEVEWSEAELDGRPALRTAVRDNGPGLSAEARGRIFEPFFTTKTHGTGLGMAIARRIVEAHGGRIAVGNGAGPGAEILVTLPRGH